MIPIYFQMITLYVFDCVFFLFYYWVIQQSGERRMWLAFCQVAGVIFMDRAAPLPTTYALFSRRVKIISILHLDKEKLFFLACSQTRQMLL